MIQQKSAGRVFFARLEAFPPCRDLEQGVLFFVQLTRFWLRPLRRSGIPGVKK
jgi:hypothetical protein